MPSKILLVLGAGPNVGLSLIKKFSQNGYKTIGVSRSPSTELQKTADLALSADLSKYENIAAIFSEAKSKIGVPCVVVYNAAAAHFTPATEPFSITEENFVKDFNLNVLSAFTALKASIEAFKELDGGEEEKTFIYTGNGLTDMNDSRMMTGVLGKRGGLVLVENAVRQGGGRFYFADERKETGEPVYGKIDGDAHGEFYFDLVKQKEQGPFQATFVKGKGYFDFEGRTGPN